MTVDKLIRLGQRLCLAGGAIGAFGLFGAIVGDSRLTAIVPGQAPMMPNTALGLLLVGGVGTLRNEAGTRTITRNLLTGASFFVLILAVATLVEYALQFDLHVDQLFVTSQSGPYAGRPSPPTALALTFLGSALLLYDWWPTARIRPSEWLLLAAALVAFTAVMGFVFGVAPYYRVTGTSVVGVAPLTAISLLLTSAGLLLERPATGVMRVVSSQGPGGVMLRRLMLPAMLAPVVLGAIVTRVLAKTGAEELSIVVAILVATTGAVGVLLITLTATPLDRAQERLEDSWTRTRNLVEQAPDGIFIADLDGRYIEVNEAGCQLIGCPREEIIGKRIVDLVPDDEVERLWKTKEALLQGATDVGEWRLRRTDGSYLPVEVSTRILPDGRWQAFVRDISERKRLERELRISEAKSTGILSISSDAIISIDADQRITLFNEGAEKIFGYSRAEAIGAALDMLIPDRLREAHRAHVAAFAASSPVSRKMGALNTTIVGVRKDGSEFPADAAISTLEVGGTRVLTVVLRDVTEQKRIEHEQRFLDEVGQALATTLDYDETLSRIAETAVRDLSDFCIVDLVSDDGSIQRLRVVSREPARAWICDWLQRVPLDHGRPHLIQAALESRQPCLIKHLSPADVEPAPHSTENLRAHSAPELESAMVVPLVAHERLLGTISFLSARPSPAFEQEDLRVAHELAQRAALAVDNARLYRAAQRASQVRDEVLGVVAHDLRNPLAVIAIEADVIQRGESASEDWARESADAIGAAVTRMKSLIRDLLDVTRLEAGRLTIDDQPVPAARVVSDAIEAYKVLASSAGLELRLGVPPDLPHIRADRARLLQVFDNLIGNAVKFTPSGGCVTVGAAVRDADVLFWVADSGPGIAEEDQAHLFDRFWQGRKARYHGGAGLGLPIVRGIVEAHHGDTWVKSTPGHGSTFFFTIPTAPRVDGTSIDSADHAPPSVGSAQSA